MKKQEHDPWIKLVIPSIEPPSLKDNRADVDRLKKGIQKALQAEEVSFDFLWSKKIPHLLREHDYALRPVLYRGRHSWRLIDLFPAHMESSLYGLAVDLGSSTVVIRLLDLIKMEVMGETSFLNPQIEIGADILTRIHFASQENGLHRLQKVLLDRLNEEIRTIANHHGIDGRCIVGMSAAGNTAMTHLFLGLDPFQMIREPYIPAANRFELLRADELGIEINPLAPVFIFPNAGSYFGGDLIAGILVSGMNQQNEVSMLVDVGTNAEVVLGNRDWLMACAGAAGPALEGGVAKMGMMAGPGVIDRVVIESDTGELSIGMIADQPPVGICGSGMIDLVAQLFLAGMIDMRGKFVKERCGERLLDEDGINHFVVVRPEDSGTGEALTLSQPDIDSLLRSKAAMYTILKTITGMANLSFQEIRHFYVAGTFGTYIDPQSAITIGMIPDLPLKTYRPLGNSSLEGASRALLSKKARDEADRIRDRITYIELNVNQEFMNRFSAAKFIPHTDKTLFPSVRLLGSK
ncbi:ASKHA domain-containing protein [Thermodesulfobacteriota bacterium]